jgi:hypothetical protein
LTKIFLFFTFFVSGFVLVANISLFILPIIRQVFQKKNWALKANPNPFFIQKERCWIFLASYCTYISHPYPSSDPFPNIFSFLSFFLSIFFSLSILLQCLQACK